MAQNYTAGTNGFGGNGRNGHSAAHGPNSLPMEANTQDPETAVQIAAIWAKRAHEIAQPPQTTITSDTLDTLIFKVGEERYSIDVRFVVKIYSMEQLTPVPRTPNFVVGVFSARGRLVSVIDLRAFFGLTTKAPDSNTKIIVLADPQQNMEVGILADSVTDVITIFKDELEPALNADIGNRESDIGHRARFTQGITSDMTVVLNAAALLRDKDLIVQEEIA